jgi:hypothetical protein
MSGKFDDDIEVWIIFLIPGTQARLPSGPSVFLLAQGCRWFLAYKIIISIKNMSNKTGARIYEPSFRENKPKTLVFSHRKRVFWAFFRENWVYKFGHGSSFSKNTIFRLFLRKLHMQVRNSLKIFSKYAFLLWILQGIWAFSIFYFRTTCITF